MSRFDYVKYDGTAVNFQELAKEKVCDLETLIESIRVNSPKAAQQAGRSVALALTSLEECYMWIGKAIRDEQIARNFPEKQQLQEERKDS